MASPDDLERIPAVLREAGERPADLGLKVAVIADNSWSALNLLDLVDSPHVQVNPDLGNIYWCYDEAEETSEDAIVALAPRAGYWHCKNLHRVQIPENRHSIFIRVPLSEGEIDYRVAISAMHDVDLDGYLAIEGAMEGDQLTTDRRSFGYVVWLLAELD
jgi:sugar phosphate isomerase/epimerase